MDRYATLSGFHAGHRSAQSAGELGAHWVRLGDQTLIWMPSDKWTGLAERARREGIPVNPAVGTSVEGQLYLVIQAGRSFQQAFPDVRTAADKGRYLVVDLLPEQVHRLAQRDDNDWTVRAFPVDSVVFDVVVPEVRAATPWVQTLASAVSQSSYAADLTWLAGLLTRHSLSSYFTDAANWALSQLQQLGYQVELRPITVGNGSSYNVVADRPGRGAGVRKLVLVTAHLDSINVAGGPTASAPGADDNASGAAGLLEIARVLATHSAEQDLRLVLFGGEEQGLYGSKQYVNNLVASERARICAVINMDMVASLNTATPTVMLEGAAISQALMNELASAAATYTSLTVQTSLNPFGSDHVPFINALVPAVLTIEGSDTANGNVHTANDIVAYVNYSLALDIVRMNVATVAGLLGIHVAVKNLISEPPKLMPKDQLKDLPKDVVKDPPKDLPKDSLKDWVKDPGFEPQKIALMDKFDMELPIQCPWGPIAQPLYSSMPSVLATGVAAKQGVQLLLRQQSAALAGIYLTLLARYSRLYGTGQLDAIGMAAWQSTAAEYQRLVAVSSQL